MDYTILFEVLFCLALGYFIGGISPSFMIGKMKGFDIREEGSHNAGATNRSLQ